MTAIFEQQDPSEIHMTGPVPETVYAHVERTVHALLDQISAALPDIALAKHGTLLPDGVKMLAEAVQALSSWPQFNPMNAHEQYQKLAEYEVERAVKAKLDSLQRDLAAEHAEIERNLSR